MTLVELNTLLKALKAAHDEIDLSTVEPSGVTKLPTTAPFEDRRRRRNSHAAKRRKQVIVRIAGPLHRETCQPISRKTRRRADLLG